ncbi:MAG: L,D-transpeptidase [Verrucomicrobiota bacterium]
MNFPFLQIFFRLKFVGILAYSLLWNVSNAQVKVELIELLPTSPTKALVAASSSPLPPELLSARFAKEVRGKLVEHESDEQPFHNMERVVVYTDPGVLEKMSPSEASIVIDLASMRLHLLAGRQVALETDLSTGHYGHRPPIGFFEMTDRVKNGPIRPSFPTRIPYWMQLGYTEFGIHGGHLFGYNAAGGCLRVPIPAARLLFAKTQEGTAVMVHDQWDPRSYIPPGESAPPVLAELAKGSMAAGGATSSELPSKVLIPVSSAVAEQPPFVSEAATIETYPTEEGRLVGSAEQAFHEGQGHGEIPGSATAPIAEVGRPDAPPALPASSRYADPVTSVLLGSSPTPIAPSPPPVRSDVSPPQETAGESVEAEVWRLRKMLPHNRPGTPSSTQSDAEDAHEVKRMRRAEAAARFAKQREEKQKPSPSGSRVPPESIRLRDFFSGKERE